MPPEAHFTPMSREVENPPASPAVTAPITVSVVDNVVQLGTGVSSPTGWSISGTTITLDPTGSQTPPVWYQFTFEMASNSGHSLVGGNLFPESHSDTTIFFPPSNGVVTLNLLNNLPGGGSEFRYHLQLFLHDDAQIAGRPQVDDPTIIFDAPPSNPVEE